MSERLPVFPLGLVIAPGGVLPLRIFEPRYLKMVKWCMTEGQGFMVVPPDGDGFAPLGTLCRIVDFDQLPDGCLGLTAHGDSQYSMSNPSKDQDGLWWADIEAIEPEADIEPQESEADLVNLLASLMQHPAVQELEMEVDYESLSEVTWRLIELLPFEVHIKQSLIETRDLGSRCDQLREALKALQSESDR